MLSKTLGETYGMYFPTSSRHHTVYMCALYSLEEKTLDRKCSFIFTPAHKVTDNYEAKLLELNNGRGRKMRYVEVFISLL